jgi:hypothetical protein
MRQALTALAILGAGAALAACAGTVVNGAQVYQPVTGVIQMDIKIPAGETVSSVQFLVDDKLVEEDTDGSDGFSAELDTTELEADSLVKITAKGVHADKTTVVLRENFILVGKQDDGAEATTDASPTPVPDATGTK